MVGAINGVEDQYIRSALVTHPGSLPGAVGVDVLNSASPNLIYPAGAVALLLMLLPEGRLPSRRWRPLLPIAVMFAVVGFALTTFAPGPLIGSSSSINYTEPQNPIGLSALKGIYTNGQNPGIGGAVVWLGGLAILLLAASAPLVRMRRSRGDVRQQLKWIAYAVLITAATTAVFSFLSGSVLPDWTFDIPILLGFGIAFPLAAGVAIFKYRLYDIDIVISRTLVYGALAVFITAVYVGIAVGI
nr:hypothetical protein [Candidatus Dormibacteraeota bacterium]